jgi:hypothetical protein
MFFWLSGGMKHRLTRRSLKKLFFQNILTMPVLSWCLSMNTRMKNSLPALLLVLFLTGFCLPASVASAAERPTLKAITFNKVERDREEIVFQLNGTYIPKTFAIKGKKPRVVFDFYGVGMALTLPNSIETSGDFVERIRLGRHEGTSPKTRVVFDLVPGKKIRFSQDLDQDNNTLTIAILPADTQLKEAARPEPVAEKKSQPVREQPPAIQPQAQEKQADKTDEQQAPAPQGDKSPAADTQPEAATVHVLPAKKPARPSSKPVQAKTPDRTKTTQTALSTDSMGIKAAVLESVVFDNSSRRGEMVQFTLTDFHPPKIFGIEEGVPRVVCDFTTTRAREKLPKIIKTKGRWVKAIRIGSHQNPDRVRVVIDLAPNNNYDLQQVFFTDENLFVIIVNTVKESQSSRSDKGKKEHK